MNAWTILIFMSVDEDALVPYALIDLRDIKRLGAISGFNVVVEVRWHNHAQNAMNSAIVIFNRSILQGFSTAPAERAPYRTSSKSVYAGIQRATTCASPIFQPSAIQPYSRCCRRPNDVG